MQLLFGFVAICHNLLLKTKEIKTRLALLRANQYLINVLYRNKLLTVFTVWHSCRRQPNRSNIRMNKNINHKCYAPVVHECQTRHKVFQWNKYFSLAIEMRNNNNNVQIKAVLTISQNHTY